MPYIGLCQRLKSIKNRVLERITNKIANLFYNTGHGHLGWTMSCGTARIIADLISGKNAEINIDKMQVR